MAATPKEGHKAIHILRVKDPVLVLGNVYASLSEKDATSFEFHAMGISAFVKGIQVFIPFANISSIQYKAE